MSMEITHVHYDPDPKHVIIRSDTSVIDCANPVDPDEWLDGAYGDTVCIYSNQYMHFEKALCDTVYFYDFFQSYIFKRSPCGSCGVMNAIGCALNTSVLNAWSAGDSTECAGDQPDVTNSTDCLTTAP